MKGCVKGWLKGTVKHTHEVRSTVVTFDESDSTTSRTKPSATACNAVNPRRYTQHARGTRHHQVSTNGQRTRRTEVDEV